jgi:hypothetical protein
MPFCPNCGYEYEAGVSACSDCGERLVDEPPREAKFSKEPAVVVYEAPNALLSQRAKVVLEEAGLPVVEVVDRTWFADDMDFSMSGRYSRLLTLESRGEEARRIIADFLAASERGELAVGEEEGED